MPVKHHGIKIEKDAHYHRLPLQDEKGEDLRLKPRTSDFYNVPNQQFSSKDIAFKHPNSESPPFVSVEGRIDTDLDRWLDEDDQKSEQSESTSVTSRAYPKPRIISVVEGSLDNDIDGITNDGTMAHKLADAPKNFHPRDLKEISAKEKHKSIPVHIKSKSSSNRSYNKMQLDTAGLEEKEHNNKKSEKNDAAFYDTERKRGNEANGENKKHSQNELGTNKKIRLHMRRETKSSSDNAYMLNKSLEKESANLVQQSDTKIDERGLRHHRGHERLSCVQDCVGSLHSKNHISTINYKEPKNRKSHKVHKTISSTSPIEKSGSHESNIWLRKAQSDKNTAILKNVDLSLQSHRSTSDNDDCQVLKENILEEEKHTSTAKYICCKSDGSLQTENEREANKFYQENSKNLQQQNISPIQYSRIKENKRDKRFRSLSNENIESTRHRYSSINGKEFYDEIGKINKNVENMPDSQRSHPVSTFNVSEVIDSEAQRLLHMLEKTNLDKLENVIRILKSDKKINKEKAKAQEPTRSAATSQILNRRDEQNQSDDDSTIVEESLLVNNKKDDGKLESSKPCANFIKENENTIYKNEAYCKKDKKQAYVQKFVHSHKNQISSSIRKVASSDTLRSSPSIENSTVRSINKERKKISFLERPFSAVTLESPLVVIDSEMKNSIDQAIQVAKKSIRAAEEVTEALSMVFKTSKSNKSIRDTISEISQQKNLKLLDEISEFHDTAQKSKSLKCASSGQTIRHTDYKQDYSGHEQIINVRNNYDKFESEPFSKNMKIINGNYLNNKKLKNSIPNPLKSSKDMYLSLDKTENLDIDLASFCQNIEAKRCKTVRNKLKHSPDRIWGAKSVHAVRVESTSKTETSTFVPRVFFPEVTKHTGKLDCNLSIESKSCDDLWDETIQRRSNSVPEEIKTKSKEIVTENIPHRTEEEGKRKSSKYPRTDSKKSTEKLHRKKVEEIPSKEELRKSHEENTKSRCKTVISKIKKHESSDDEEIMEDRKEAQSKHKPTRGSELLTKSNHKRAGSMSPLQKRSLSPVQTEDRDVNSVRRKEVAYSKRKYLQIKNYGSSVDKQENGLKSPRTGTDIERRREKISHKNQPTRKFKSVGRSKREDAGEVDSSPSYLSQVTSLIGKVVQGSENKSNDLKESYGKGGIEKRGVNKYSKSTRQRKTESKGRQPNTNNSFFESAEKKTDFLMDQCNCGATSEDSSYVSYDYYHLSESDDSTAFSSCSCNNLCHKSQCNNKTFINNHCLKGVSDRRNCDKRSKGTGNCSNNNNSDESENGSTLEEEEEEEHESENRNSKDGAKITKSLKGTITSKRSSEFTVRTPDSIASRLSAKWKGALPERPMNGALSRTSAKSRGDSSSRSGDSNFYDEESTFYNLEDVVPVPSSYRHYKKLTNRIEPIPFKQKFFGMQFSKDDFIDEPKKMTKYDPNGVFGIKLYNENRHFCKVIADIYKSPGKTDTGQNGTRAKKHSATATLETRLAKEEMIMEDNRKLVSRLVESAKSNYARAELLTNYQSVYERMLSFSRFPHLTHQRYLKGMSRRAYEQQAAATNLPFGPGNDHYFTKEPFPTVVIHKPLKSPFAETSYSRDRYEKEFQNSLKRMKYMGRFSHLWEKWYDPAPGPASIKNPKLRLTPVKMSKVHCNESLHNRTSSIKRKIKLGLKPYAPKEHNKLLSKK